jgi:hypothetical protein
VRRTIIACVVVALVAGATSATAAKLITGDDIKDGSITGADIHNPTITNKDIKKGTIIKKKLSKAVQDALEQQGGPAGPKGDKGAKGDKGDPGPTQSAGNWGIQNRNVNGAPNISLRSGPPPTPLGSGSLNFLVAAGQTAAFGNEVDTFAGGEVDNLNQVGFRVYTTGENSARGNPNMPSITFEIDPNLTSTTSGFSSLVFVPATNSPSNQWSDYIDATDASQGFWWLTGAAGTATTCTLAAECTFDEVTTALADGDPAATILTVSVRKGADFAWQGAIDGLRINGNVYDFEEHGVVERDA